MVQEREGIEMAQVARKIRTGKHVSEGDSGRHDRPQRLDIGRPGAL
jgi:hypothetical protein